MRPLLAVLAFWILTLPSFGQANSAAQDAADVLRSFTAADGAFLPSGHVKGAFDKSDLATILEYPLDNPMVLQLTGSQIRQALERSVSLFPQPNKSFLQLSGFDVTFSQGAPPYKRILSVTVNGSPLEDKKTYTVAMPSSLGLGTLGYFKIWDKPNISKTFDKVKMEDVLRGKRATGSVPRWSAQP